MCSWLDAKTDETQHAFTVVHQFLNSKLPYWIHQFTQQEEHKHEHQTLCGAHIAFRIGYNSSFMEYNHNPPFTRLLPCDAVIRFRISVCASWRNELIVCLHVDHTVVAA